MKANTKRYSSYLALLAGILFSLPVAADINDLLEMSEKLDKIERQDFGDAIDKANGCTRSRDFACTNSWLAKAAKLANGTRDKQMLAAAQQSMANEKARIAEEARLRAEEERRIAEAEERLRVAEAEAARRASQSREPSTGAQLFQLGVAIAGNVYAEKARLAAAAANSGRSQSGGLPLADLSAERRAIEKARADAATAQRARDQANASRLAQANATPVAPQRTPIADLREQTIGSRMAAANTPSATAVQRQPTQMAMNNPSVYPTPQPTMQPWRENCPPGTKPMAHSNGMPVTSPAGGACVSDPEYAGRSGAQTSSGAGSQSTSSSPRTASSSSAGSAGSSNKGGSGNRAGSPTGYPNAGNPDTGGYPNAGGYPPTAGSSQTPGGSSTPGGSPNTRVATSGGGSSTTGGGYPGMSGSGDNPSGSSRPKKLYPLVRHFTYPTLGNTQEDACAEATKKVDEHIANGTLGTIINRAGCSCTREALVIGGSMIQCKIAITDQLMVDYDPNAPTSNTSR